MRVGAHRPPTVGCALRTNLSGAREMVRVRGNSIPLPLPLITIDSRGAMGDYYRGGRIAQLGEHRPYKPGVTGSSPVPPTKFISSKFKVQSSKFWLGAVDQIP